MKLRILSLLLCSVMIAVTGCSDIQVDPDSSDASSANTQTSWHREDGHMTVEVTAENYEALVNSGTPVLLDFWATWCGPCVALTPTLEELAKEYDGELIIGKVNVDEQSKLADKFNVSPIPALFYLKDGEIVGDQTGLKSKAELKAKIKQAFSL